MEAKNEGQQEGQEKVLENSANPEQPVSSEKKTSKQKVSSYKPASLKQSQLQFKDPDMKSFKEVEFTTKVFNSEKKLVETKVVYKPFCYICKRTFGLMGPWKRRRHLDSKPHQDMLKKYFERLRFKTEGVTNRSLMT